GSHTHTLSTGFVNHLGAAATNIAAFDNSGPQLITGTGALTTTTVNTGASSCPSGTVLVSPGYIVNPASIRDDTPTTTDPSPGMMRLYKSITGNSRDWEWRFENSALPLNWTVTVTTYWRCLQIKLPT